MFHLMGYMIFQYQHRLGYVAEKDTGEVRPGRSVAAKYLSTIQILTKLGRLDKADALYRKALKECPGDEALNQNWFQFNLGLLPHTEAQAGEVCDRYLAWLISNQQRDKLYGQLSRILLKLQDYRPQRPALRHELAQTCLHNGNPKLAVKLLTGLHKEFPEYRDLTAAYHLLAKAMDELPGMEATAAKCRQFTEQLQQRAEQTDAQASPQQAHPAAQPVAATSPQSPRKPVPPPPPGSFNANSLTLQPLDEQQQNRDREANNLNP
jgi:tetratricopeptide (TPR) repeat protein